MALCTFNRCTERSCEMIVLYVAITLDQDVSYNRCAPHPTVTDFKMLVSWKRVSNFPRPLGWLDRVCNAGVQPGALRGAGHGDVGS